MVQNPLERAEAVLTGKYSSYIANLLFLVGVPALAWYVAVWGQDWWMGASVLLLLVTLGTLIYAIRKRLQVLAWELYWSGDNLHAIRLDEQGLQMDIVEHPELPKGHTWLRWAAFVRPTPANKPDVIDIRTDPRPVTSVYLLVATGYGVKSSEGMPAGAGWDEKLIGSATLIFADGSHQSVDLRLGHNIREFTYGNQPWAIDALRAEGESSFQVWHSSDDKYTLDMLVIPVGGKARILESIRVLARMDEGTGPISMRAGDGRVLEPAYPIIRIFGVACRSL